MAAAVVRAEAGNKVIDQEIVTRNLADGPARIEVIAIYNVESGKIAKAWFIFGPSTRMNKRAEGQPSHARTAV
jgi:hypothetical protein